MERETIDGVHQHVLERVVSRPRSIEYELIRRQWIRHELAQRVRILTPLGVVRLDRDQNRPGLLKPGAGFFTLANRLVAEQASAEAQQSEEKDG